MAWAAFQVKKIYNSNPQYVKLRDILIYDLGFKEEEIYFPGDLEKENPLGSYVFVQVPDMDKFIEIWPKLIDTKFVSAFDGYLEIPNDQMQKMLDKSVEPEKTEEINVYDIVKIKYGPYSRMFGVVLSKKEKDMYEIGFKLFTGPQFKDLPSGHLEKMSSLFEIWKFPVTDEGGENEQE